MGKNKSFPVSDIVLGDGFNENKVRFLRGRRGLRLFAALFEKERAVVKKGRVHSVQKGVFVLKMAVQGRFTNPQLQGYFSETCSPVKIPPPDLKGCLDNIVVCHRLNLVNMLPTVR
jgi:hypothetical protein